MWLATLGRAGLITCCVLIPALYWSLTALGPEPVFSFASFLVPLVIIAISSAVYASARRFAAQRDLLDAQAARLAFARSAAVQQEQLVTEVLDTVDFGVVRFSVGGDVVYENDAVGRLGGSMPRLHAAGETRVLLQEDGETPLDAHDHPLARARRGESFEDETVWSQDAEGRRVALTFTARRLLDHRGADAGGVLVARDGSRQRRTPARDHLRHPAHLAAVAHLGGGRRAPSRDRCGRARARVGARARSGRCRPGDQGERDGDGARRRVADPGRLRQVIDNLLGNAIKFNRDGGAVDVTVSTDGEATTIAVRDTGVGIAAEDQEHVFERFFRASEDVAGNGLGLAISADIIKAHDGTLTVASDPGVGSTFTIVLPAHAETRTSR